MLSEFAWTHLSTDVVQDPLPSPPIPLKNLPPHLTGNLLPCAVLLSFTEYRNQPYSEYFASSWSFYNGIHRADKESYSLEVSGCEHIPMRTYVLENTFYWLSERKVIISLHSRTPFSLGGNVCRFQAEKSLFYALLACLLACLYTMISLSWRWPYCESSNCTMWKVLARKVLIAINQYSAGGVRQIISIHRMHYMRPGSIGESAATHLDTRNELHAAR